MQSPWIRDAAKACCSGCCPNPFPGLPKSHSATSETPITAAEAFRYKFEVSTVATLYPNFNFTNHESLPSFEETFSYFNKVYPQYSQTDEADKIRAHEYYHLSITNHVYLDYIGHGLFSYSQLENQCPGSPVTSSSLESPFFDVSYKSVSLKSQLLYCGEESEFQSSMRKRIMAFMSISEADYNFIFTANQSAAFKLVAECYPFQYGRNLVTVYDHQSEAVEVMIERSKKRGANAISASFSWPNLEIQTDKLRKKISKRKKKGLFVFPLQSRVTGSRYSYTWMSLARENGWHLLLDASALGAKDMDTLGLSLFSPDFLVCSFYKVFGENPSGFCCLFVKKSSTSVLKDSTTSVGVGIVNLVPVSWPARIAEKPAIVSTIETKKKVDEFPPIQGSFSGPLSIQHKNNEDEAGHEVQKPEGKGTKSKKKTVSFSEIEEVIEASFEPGSTSNTLENKNPKFECRSLDHADSLGVVLIKSRTRNLVNWLVNALTSLQHPHSETGVPAVRIYGPQVSFDRGPAVAFNVFDWKGERIDPTMVQKLADRNNIALSIGTLHHIWFSDKHEEEKEKKALETVLSSNRRDNLGCGITVVTAALGFLTNFEDVYRVWAFVSRFLDADFLEKERWRYKAINQKTVEII